jgi:hypothetical protein
MLQARKLGKELFVGIHSDEAILENKGPTVMTLDERLVSYRTPGSFFLSRISVFPLLRRADGLRNLSLMLRTSLTCHGYRTTAVSTSSTEMISHPTATETTAIDL